MRQFITDFVTYQRDLKYCRLMREAMEAVNLMTDETEMETSRLNNTLYEFLEEEEYISTSQSIRSHVIVKAELRGITRMKDTLCQRGFDAVAHLNRHFFDPVSQLIEKFGAEKLSIDENAVMFCFLEYENQVKDWYTVARACGLAKNILAVLYKQNKANCALKLPELELGIGICYSPKSPELLYDGDQRVIISPLVDAVDMMSSCAWKLRCKYKSAEKPKQILRVMVFQQPPPDGASNKKMTNSRYNINGIELDAVAFKKLQSEVTALRHFKIRLPGDDQDTRFYAGSYPDANGQRDEVMIRESRVKEWQDNCDDYPLTDELYYEVVTNQQIINFIKKQGG